MGIFDKFGRKKKELVSIPPANTHNERTKAYKLYEAFLTLEPVNLYEMITPLPLGGMGLASYRARISEMRDYLRPLGWTIECNKKKFTYKLVEIED